MKSVIVAIFISSLLLPIEVVANTDSDGDGLSDKDEIELYGTNPQLKDSDGDGFEDKTELDNGYSPTSSSIIRLNSIDTDKDGLWDDWEVALGTSLINTDTDGDGFSDGLEVDNDFDPRGTSANKLEKFIIVRLSDQSLHYFFGNTRLSGFKISSGLTQTPTPPDSYAIIKKRPSVQYGGAGFDFYYPNTKWNLMFKYGSWGNYYIHGAYWHNNFGRQMSHGCVNAPYTYETMGRLYDWAEEGTAVTVK
jgi:hypothetical protein